MFSLTNGLFDVDALLPYSCIFLVTLGCKEYEPVTRYRSLCGGSVTKDGVCVWVCRGTMFVLFGGGSVAVSV